MKRIVLLMSVVVLWDIRQETRCFISHISLSHRYMLWQEKPFHGNLSLEMLNTVITNFAVVRYKIIKMWCGEI